MINQDQLIDQLVDELEPVRGLSIARARMLAAAIAIASAVVLVMILGMRPDFVAGAPHPLPLLCLLLTLVVAVAAIVNVTAMARPAVGAARGGWPWSIAALAVLPLAALVTGLANLSEMITVELALDGSACFFIGSATAAASIAVLALLLKRGAPSSAARASWLIGVAGGCVGATAVALTCPSDSIVHIGIWHAAIVPISAIASRVAVAPLLRW
jgi:hypothetical protein